MSIEIERRIAELCDLAARENDYGNLKHLIEQLLECIVARDRQRQEAKAKSESEEQSARPPGKDNIMKTVLRDIWNNNEGQDIAEYAVLLAVILVLVVGTVRLIGSNSNNVFSSVASSIH